MSFLNECQHSEWEFDPSTQRKVSATIFAIIVVVVALNLADGWKYNFWQARTETVASPVVASRSYE